MAEAEASDAVGDEGGDLRVGDPAGAVGVHDATVLKGMNKQVALVRAALTDPGPFGQEKIADLQWQLHEAFPTRSRPHQSSDPPAAGTAAAAAGRRRRPDVAHGSQTPARVFPMEAFR